MTNRLQHGIGRPNRVAAVHLRLLADDFNDLPVIKVVEAEDEDWEAVEAALVALESALGWLQS